MIEPGHEKLSMRRQAALLGINRNRLERGRPHPARAAWEEDQKALRELDRLHTRWPFYGQRKLPLQLGKAGLVVNRKRLRRLMREANVKVVAPKPWTSQPQASHAKYPYPLRDLKVEAVDQGCQFTGQQWITAVESQGSRASMDGRDRWMDDVFIERLWRSLKVRADPPELLRQPPRVGGRHGPVDERLPSPSHSPSPRLHRAVGALSARRRARHRGRKG